MIELRQFINYVIVLALAAGMFLAVSSYAIVEGVQYVPDAPANVSAAKKEVELTSAEMPMEGNTRPVWIAPTPKYSYDPKLMIVKSRVERLQEAELRRKQEVAQYSAKQRAYKAQRQIAQQRREQRLLAEGGTYAYQPERRQTLGLFSLFH